MGLLGDFFSRGFDDAKKAAYQEKLEEAEKWAEEELDKEKSQESAWQCDNCGKIAYAIGEPRKRDVGECIGWKSFSDHRWVNLGKSGNRKYYCANCGCVVYLYWSPHLIQSGNCNAVRGESGYSNHAWRD